MELKINYYETGFDALKVIKEGKIHVIASEPTGVSPAGCYMIELNIQLTNKQRDTFYETLSNKRETVCLYPKNLSVVPLDLSEENTIECFDANEKYIRAETMYFDLEKNNNDIYEIVAEAIKKYQFTITKNIYIDARDVEEKWKK